MIPLLLLATAVNPALVICNPAPVRDGDTFYCGGGYFTQIRDSGINAVEWGQPGYEEAKAHLRVITSRGTVRCKWDGTTSYHRLNAYCTDVHGRDIGQQMIRWSARLHQPWVVEWCYYSQNRYGTCPADHTAKTWTNQRPN
jgi:endonuclease YncB( thermonuclease family)